MVQDIEELELNMEPPFGDVNFDRFGSDDNIEVTYAKEDDKS